MVLGQKSIDVLNPYGQLLLDKYIAITIVLLITILQNYQICIMLCHDRFMKFKPNRYHSKNSKSDEIHLGLEVTYSTKTLSRRPVALYFRTKFNFYVSLLYSLKNWEKSAHFWERYKVLYVEKVLLSQAEEVGNYLHINKNVLKVDSKGVSIMGNGLFYSWKY